MKLCENKHTGKSTQYSQESCLSATAADLKSKIEAIVNSESSCLIIGETCILVFNEGSKVTLSKCLSTVTYGKNSYARNEVHLDREILQSRIDEYTELQKSKSALFVYLLSNSHHLPDLFSKLSGEQISILLDAYQNGRWTKLRHYSSPEMLVSEESSETLCFIGDHMVRILRVVSETGGYRSSHEMFGINTNEISSNEHDYTSGIKRRDSKSFSSNREKLSKIINLTELASEAAEEMIKRGKVDHTPPDKYVLNILRAAVNNPSHGIAVRNEGDTAGFPRQATSVEKKIIQKTISDILEGENLLCCWIKSGSGTGGYYDVEAARLRVFGSTLIFRGVGGTNFQISDVFVRPFQKYLLDAILPKLREAASKYDSCFRQRQFECRNKVINEIISDIHNLNTEGWIKVNRFFGNFYYKKENQTAGIKSILFKPKSKELELVYDRGLTENLKVEDEILEKFSKVLKARYSS